MEVFLVFPKSQQANQELAKFQPEKPQENAASFMETP